MSHCAFRRRISPYNRLTLLTIKDAQARVYDGSRFCPPAPDMG